MAKTPNWLNPREMKAWRSYIIASRRLLDALDFDLDQHDLSMADYEVWLCYLMHQIARCE